MSKVAVVFWTQTGNTQIMADAVVEGARGGGADVDVFGPSDFGPDKLSQYDGVAFGCPAMGAEVLEESEFEPMFISLDPVLAGKKIGLSGSYGWGDGQWMRDWEARAAADGANLVMEGVMANYEPTEDDLARCRDLGAALN